ncbi:serpentine type 7TM GPCR chemoreceptor srh domain-containing protein [Ditylenchus destructor]|uniref:Serpentine type 7TM GPCR chemoreceptor srh domain-containing protein n=1 Tax=Ditylenchus destructor TaxID=166010 RepID=A0AAD4MMH8_9BILA|nr:serpentine type 7TM GPCR chemoreceptor srh domain-containing protein [Ditylenchus destructor]
MLKNSMFGRTYKMHKSLTISLCIQFAVPTCMVFCAEICSGLSVAMFQVNLAHAIFYASYIFATMHTFVSGIIMIALVKPYRKACADIVCSLFQKIHRWETKSSDLSLVMGASSSNRIVKPNGMLRSSFP